MRPLAADVLRPLATLDLQLQRDSTGKKLQQASHSVPHAAIDHSELDEFTGFEGERHVFPEQRIVRPKTMSACCDVDCDRVAKHQHVIGSVVDTRVHLALARIGVMVAADRDRAGLSGMSHSAAPTALQRFFMATSRPHARGRSLDRPRVQMRH
jgi:hypothetical protein